MREVSLASVNFHDGRNAACAIVTAQAAFLPSEDFSEVVEKYQLYAENCDYLLKTTYVVGISSGLYEVLMYFISIIFFAGAHTV